MFWNKKKSKKATDKPDKKSSRFRKEKPPKISKSVINLLPICDYDEDREYYIYKDGTIMNLVQFICKDLTTTNVQDIEMDILQLTKHLRLYSDDAKIISINIPVDCKTQIDYLAFKIEHCRNEIQKRFLQKSMEEQIWLQKNRLNKEFYYMFFASNPDKYEENYKALMDTLYQAKLITLMSKEKKDTVLYKLCNKNLRR